MFTTQGKENIQNVREPLFESSKSFEDLHNNKVTNIETQASPEEKECLNQNQEKTFFQRAFSKMNEGSIRGSIITLSASCCGSGVMVMSNLCVHSGILLVLLAVIFAGIGCYWGHYMLTQRARHLNIKTFADLSDMAGGKILKLVLIWSILSFLFAGCLACQIIITQLFVMLANIVGVDPSVTGKVENDPCMFKTIQAILMCLFVIYPLSLTPKMTGLRYISILSVVSMIYIVLLLVSEFPIYYNYYYNNPEFNLSVNLFTFDFQFFNVVGVIYFSYTNQSQLMIIHKELASPSKPRIQKVIGRASWLIGFFYIFVPTFGYLSTLQLTPTVIVTRPMVGGQDYFQIIAMFALMIILLVKILAMAMPFKINLYQLIYGTPEITRNGNLAICALYCSTTCFLSIVFPKVSTVLGIIGGVASVNICFLIPLIIYISLRKKDDSLTNMKNLSAIIFFTFLCVAGWLSVGSSIMYKL